MKKNRIYDVTAKQEGAKLIYYRIGACDPLKVESYIKEQHPDIKYFKIREVIGNEQRNKQGNFGW